MEFQTIKVNTSNTGDTSPYIPIGWISNEKDPDDYTPSTKGVVEMDVTRNDAARYTFAK